MPDANHIAVAPETPEQQKAAGELAEQLNLPSTEITDKTAQLLLLLVVTAQRLELRQTGPKAPGPVYVDFTSGKADFRRRYGSSRDEAVVRAVASKRNRTPTVLDATGGLGRDAFVLASHGCLVMICEKHPVIAALLDDGLRRAATDSKVGAMIMERLELVQGDSLDLMRNMEESKRPEAIYLDPMYPHQDKSAKVKKEMMYLRILAGPDLNGADLLRQALTCARQRVVVKRPATAPTLTDRQPDLVQTAGVHRFDIYLIAYQQ